MLCSGATIEADKAAAAAFETAVGRAFSSIDFTALKAREPLRKGEEGSQIQAPRDAFMASQECSRLDAHFLMRPALPEALAMLRPCMERLSRDSGVPIFAAEGLVLEQQGIVIAVSGPIPSGNRIVEDLEYTLQIRNGSLLSYPARVLQTYEALQKSVRK
ncbi:MAG: hypothetical protein HY922_00580 [Elusimicrobia bacterium]|nr:hypothetical protein [Elusimicrobiota bacterium]